MSQLINREWLQPGDQEHRLYAAHSDISDGAGHELVTAYPVQRPDGAWALLIVNKDQENAHEVSVRFEDGPRAGSFAGPVTAIVLGRNEYAWHPEPAGGRADPDGPPKTTQVAADAGVKFALPAASVTVLRGAMAWQSGPAH